jgi:type II secretory pathway component GspD/PulD (secretin)
LAALSDNSQLIVMDRYENVQRITQIIRTLDVPSGSNVPPLRRE